MLYKAETIFMHYKLVLEKLRDEIINRNLDPNDTFINIEISVPIKVPGRELVCLNDTLSMPKYGLRS